MASERASLEFAHSTYDVQEALLQRTAQRWVRTRRAIFLGLALLVWLAFAEDAVHERRLTLAAVAQRDSNLATAVEHYMVRVLRTARAVHRLMDNLVVEGRNDTELVALLADRLRANDAFRELGLCLADGRVLPAPPPGAYLTVATCAELAERTPSGSGVTVLPPVNAAGGLQVPLTLAIEAGDERLAVGVALTPVESLLGIMHSTVLREDTAVLVSGADGVPRAAWRSPAGHVVEAGGFAALSGLLRAGGGGADIAGRDYLVSSRAVPDAGLRVHVATAADAALAAFHARRARLLALCLLFTLGLAAVCRLLERMHDESLAQTRALSRARADLQELNERLDQQVQQRTAQLEQAYHDLETFSYTVAHDVRAPLASIAGFADALQPALAQSGSEKDRHYLRRIQANATQLDELTRHLLELGRLTRAPLVPADVDLSALAGDVLARLREAEPHRMVDVAVEPGLHARGDRALLRQVLENLLGNAWKFTSRRATACIAFGREPVPGGGHVFFVDDDGEGFDSEGAHGLFLPFRRMHDAGAFPGSGVGLASVQRIVVLHGGRVWCRSQQGAGARFFFSLPA